MEPISVTPDQVGNAEGSAADEFEPSNSREFYLASRDAFTTGEIESLACASSKVLGAQATLESLESKRVALPMVGQPPAYNPRYRIDTARAKRRVAVPFVFAATVLTGGFSVREGLAARAAILRERDGFGSNRAASDEGWRTIATHAGPYALIFGGVSLAGYLGYRSYLARRSAEQSTAYWAYGDRQRAHTEFADELHRANHAKASEETGYNVARKQMIRDAEKRLDDHAWKRHSEDVGYEIARTYVSPLGLQFTSRRGFNDREIAYLDSVDRRRCGLLMGKSFLQRPLTDREYELVLSALGRIDPPAANGSTRRGELFLEITRDPDGNQLDQYRINEMLLARARDRDGFLGVKNAREAPRQSARRDLVLMFDEAFRQMMIGVKGKDRPAKIRLPSGFEMTCSTGFTEEDIASWVADDEARTAHRELSARRADAKRLSQLREAGYLQEQAAAQAQHARQQWEAQEWERQQHARVAAERDRTERQEWYRQNDLGHHQQIQNDRR